MGLPFTFANVTELDTPNLDSNFNALGALTVIPCVAVGTNAITLTPIANAPTIAAYSNNAPIFGFQAAASTTTSPVTAQVGGLAALNIYKANGAALIGPNDFLIGLTYYVAFVQALNSGAGGWILINPGASASTAGAVQSSFKNLLIKNGGTPTTQITLTADAVAVSDGATNFTTLLIVNVTLTSSTSGANGIDTGAIANTTWYAVYLIYNPTTLTAAGLISTSFTTPTLPSGFTQFSRLGAFRTDGSAHFLNIRQPGRRAQYTTGTNLPQITNNAQGTNNGTTFTGVSTSLAAFVPPTATRLNFSVANGNTANNCGLAPNNGFSGFGGATNPVSWEVAIQGGIVAGEFALETLNVFYAAGGAASQALAIGWEDNI